MVANVNRSDAEVMVTRLIAQHGMNATAAELLNRADREGATDFYAGRKRKSVFQIRSEGTGWYLIYVT